MDLFGLNISRARTAGPINVPPPTKAELPPSGKSSKSPGEILAAQFSIFEGMKPPDTRIWTYIELAALYNPDISAAIHTIKSLADTPYNIVSETGDPLSEQAQDVIGAFKDRCFPLAGGMDGFQLALIRMFAKFGALSTEAEILKDRSGIKQLWFVPVPEIRFKFEDGVYTAHQSITGVGTGNLIPLNPITYQFLCAEFWEDGKPYAKPPMTAAIDGILRGDNILTNIDYIIEKVGLLGIRDIAFAPLKPNPGDVADSPSHVAKNIAFQAKIMASEEDHKRDGVRVHTNDIDYTLTQAAVDTRGVADIYKLNEEQISAGTGIAEALYGRSRQTTEAFAKVMYLLALNYAEIAQRLSGNFSSYFVNLELALKGINEKVKFEHDPIPPLDAQKDAEAEYKRIETIALKEGLGYIDHERAVNEAGYEDIPDEKPEPEPEPEPVEEEPVEEQSLITIPAILSRSAMLKELTPKARKFIRDFIKATNDAAGGAEIFAMGDFETFMESRVAGDFTGAEDFARQLMETVGSGWAAAGSEFQEAVESTVPALYEYLIISDASVWHSATPPIEFVFGEGSQNLVNFARLFEPHLCTTLWSDPTCPENKALGKYLEREFLDRGADIFSRTNPEGYRTFRNAFGRQLGHLSDYQIRRIQDTFVMRCRNGSMLEQLHQARTKTARISTTVTCCEICEPYEGKEFAVEPQYEAMQSQMAMSPDEYLGFLRDNNDTIRSGTRQKDDTDADYKKRGDKAWATLQEQGLCLPPYHPICGHDLVEP